MKNKNLVLIFLLFVSICSFAQLDRSKKPTAGPAPEIKLGEYESFVLQNGLKVFVVTNNKLPVVFFNLVIDRDPILEGKSVGYVGIAGQLLRTGTKTRTKDKLDEEIDFIGATLSTSSSNVYASSLKKHVNKILDLMSDVVLNPNFKQEELDKVIKQTLSQLAADKEDPNAISTRVGDVVFFGKDHQYGEVETEETVKTITLDLCNKYYQEYFHPNAAYLAIVGDINKAEAQKLVEKYFGKWQSKESPKGDVSIPKAPLINKVALIDRPSSVQSVLNIGYPVELKKGSEDVIKASVLNTILGGSFISRINKNLRETNGYTYGARTSLSSDKYIGKFTATTEVRNSVTDSAITEIISEMKKIRNEKVTDEELILTKNYMTGGFARSLENPQTIANFAIDIERYSLPKDYYKNYLKNLNDVTSDDILATSKKYIKPNNLNLVVVGNAEEIAKNLTRFSITGKIDYYDINGEKYDPNVKNIPEGVTIEQILNKYVEVIGGKENVEKIKDRTMTLKGSVQGMDISVVIYQKYPNKLFQTIDIGGMYKMKTTFDGEKGKADQMEQVQDLAGDQLEEMKGSGMDAMLDYSKYGFKTELSSMENINGKEAYKITLTSATGKKSTQYYSVETGFLIRSVSQISSPQGTVTQTTDMDDYRDVQGMKYPFKLSQNFGPQTIDLTVSSIETNTGLSDALFEVK
jgi:zinc protease